MLPKKLLLLFCFLSFAILNQAQKTPTVDKQQTNMVSTISSETIERSPFTRNFNEFTIQQNFDFSRLKPENSNGHTSNVNLNIDYNRFIVDHFALGVQFQESFSKTEMLNYTYKNNNWMAYGNIIYGTTFTNSFNLYGKASLGFGQSKNDYSSTTTKNDLFGYKLEIGSPIHLFSNGGNYFTPFIVYQFQQKKTDAGKYTNNDFRLGFRFENYSPCSEYECDCRHNRIFSGNMYDRGRSFIGYSSMGDFGFGNSKYIYNGNENKTDLCSDWLDLEYGYYFIPNLAIGAGMRWNSQTQKTGGSKYTNSELLFTPMLTANLPAKNSWNNLFVQGGYGFGYEKSSSGSGNQKNNLSNYCLNLGFNDFFGKHLAFTPKIGYDWQSSKNTTTNVKTQWSGPEFSMGVSLHF